MPIKINKSKQAKLVWGTGQVVQKSRLREVKEVSERLKSILGSRSARRKKAGRSRLAEE